MLTPLKSLGYQFLHRTLKCDAANPDGHLHLTRRSFLLVAAALSSCAGKKPEDAAAGTYVANTTPSQTNGYSSTRIIPRNPNLRLSSSFPLGSNISYSKALVSGKFIAMTFDDGPHPQNTPRLLDMLRERNIKATFFVIGRSVENYPDVLRRTVDEGHEIGNHTQTHRLLSSLDDSQVRWELSSCRNAVLAAAGYEMKVMRPPYGGMHQRQRELVAAEFGYPTILWSVDPLDWKRPGASVVSSRILRATNPGGIILSHDIHSPTVDAMPATLDELLYRGYQFVTVSQLLAMNTQTAPAPSQAAPVSSQAASAPPQAATTNF